MRVLAHVILNGSLPSEPAATQALAHILSSAPDITRAFVGMLCPADIDFEPGRISAELGHEDSRPDLTIHVTVTPGLAVALAHPRPGRDSRGKRLDATPDAAGAECGADASAGRRGELKSQLRTR